MPTLPTSPSGAVGEQQAAHLYRIAQEGLSNALRHAEAKRVDTYPWRQARPS